MSDTLPEREPVDEPLDEPVSRHAASPAFPKRTRSVFLSLCQLMIRTQVTRTRVIALGLMAALGILVGWAIGLSHGRSTHLRAGTEFINLYGLSLLVPVATLVFASSMFGDPTDDNTLVYLWLRPIARWKLVASAALTTLIVTWPLVVPALCAAAALTRGGSDVVVGTLISSTVMVLAYTGLYVALGLRVKRPLVWGLLYTFIWEGFVARGSENAAKAAVRAYGSSLLHNYTGSKLVLGDFDFTWAVFIPLAAGALGLVYATYRLRRQDVA